MDPLRIGIIGVGNISGIYFENLGKFRSTEVVAVADLDLDRAKSVAEKQGIGLAMTPDELLAHGDIELVLNLTVPKAHFSVALAAVEAGKSVYNEKPLTVTREDGQRLMAAAHAKGVLVGCAPDTFLGGAHQTARALIDSGVIGEPVAAQANMLCHGHETWHPSPEFYYEVGGGPMLDMGPYYLTALVQMIGPVRRVTGSVRATFPTRTITSQPKAGKVIEVETPTHYSGVLDFVNGAIGEITTSFDVWGSKSPLLTVYGTEGTLLVPDPNGFGGEILLAKPGKEWEAVPLTHGFAGNSRGVGVLDMAYAIRTGTSHLASGDLALHVLDVMQSIKEASEKGHHVELTTTVARPGAFAADQYADEA
ncbi:MAG: Gfo/Idh/MocA family protein [Fimbriimonas sp.]